MKTRGSSAQLSSEELAQLSAGNPVVRCTVTQTGCLTVSFFADDSPDFRGTFEIVSAWLPKNTKILSWDSQATKGPHPRLANHRLVQTVVTAHIDTIEALNPADLAYQIAQTLKLPGHAQKLHSSSLAPKELPGEAVKKLFLKAEILNSPTPLQGVSEETVRLCLALPPQFTTLRSVSHLVQLAHAHHRLHNPKYAQGQRCVFRIVPALLRFPFGTKTTLGLVIALRGLSEYERFDHRHVLRACQSSLPSLELVPHSFYSFRYPNDRALALYVEVEKQDGSALAAEELDLLKRTLGIKLAASVEQMVSRIEIPQNEEDVLRNFLLLSQRKLGYKNYPKVIIQYYEQTNQVLDFHATCVRTTRGKTQTFLPLKKLPPNIVKFSLLRASIIDSAGGKAPRKEGALFTIQCLKEPFLRGDRSIDFLRAREAVVNCIEQSFGKIYDFNGSLIYQQHQVIESLVPLLSEEEAQDLSIAEDLFFSLSPSLMKNLLGPEHVLTIFRQFLALRKETSKQIIIEEYAKELFIGFILPENFTKEEILQAQLRYQLKEHEFAMCHKTDNGRAFCFVICVSHNLAVRQDLSKWLQEQINVRTQVATTKSIRISLPLPITIIDPRISTDRASRALIKMLYEGLMRLDRSGTPANALAQRVEISDDGKVYTFVLRPSVWSNGRPLTSADFEYAWKRILEPTFHNQFAYVFYPIKNAAAIKRGEMAIDTLGVRSPSPRTLVVELENPAPYFLELCCLWIYSPLCRALEKANPGWAYARERDYMCNGPFRLVRRLHADSLQLEKNELFWDKEQVSLEHIFIRVERDPLRTLRLFERGEIDWLGEPLCDIPTDFVGAQDPRLHSKESSAIHWYMLNTQNILLSSAKVRWALSLAIDRQTAIQKYGPGGGLPSCSVLPRHISLVQPPPLAYSPDKAKRLFQEGLAELGLTLRELRPLRMSFYQESLRPVAAYVAETWEQSFGLSVDLGISTREDTLGGQAKKPFDVVGIVWCPWHRDPLYTLEIISDGTNPINLSRWTDKAVRSILGQAEREPHREHRTKLLLEAERLLLEAMPVVPLFDCTSRYMQRSAIDNICISPSGTVDFTWATCSPPASAAKA